MELIAETFIEYKIFMLHISIILIFNVQLEFK